MSKNVRVRPEDFSNAVIKALAEYGDEVNEIIEASTKDAARATKSDLKASAPAGGSYARGWSNKAHKAGRYNLVQVVYNRTDYQLIHLLEKPHPVGRYGKKYPTHVDYTGTLARIEEEQTDKYYEEVIAKL